MSRPELKKRTRGFTLLELMIAAAIGLITVIAAMAMFTGIRTMIDDADRMLVTSSDLQLGTSMVQRTIENAGYHFPSSNMAIIVHKNVGVGVMPNGTGNAPNGNVTIVARSPISPNPYVTADEGIVDQSDVIEVLSGTPAGNTVTVNKPTSAGGPTFSVTFSAPTAGAGVDVLALGQNPILLFRNKTVECVGEVTAAVGGPLQPFTITILDENFQPNPAPPAGCPASNMTVYRLSDRTRYMVYQFAGETRPMLAMQRMDTAKPTVGVLSTTIERLVEGIEDLQVAELLENNGICGVGPATCTCDDGQDDGAGGDCVLDAVNAVNVRGVVLELTSRGQRDRKRDLGELPASMDRPKGPRDDVLRQQFRMAIAAPNLNPSLVATGP